MAGRGIDAISINQRFLKMETQLNAIQNGLDAMDKNPAVTLEHLEAAKTELTQNTSDALKKLAATQVDILDQRLQKEKQNTLAEINKVNSKVTNLEKTTAMQNANVLSQLEEKTKDLKTLGALKKLLEDLLRRVKALEEDVEE